MRSRLRSGAWTGRASALALACALGLAGAGNLPAQVTTDPAAPSPSPEAGATPSSEAMATLLADRVSIERDNRLVAEGNIEIYYHSRRLTATRVIYDRKTDKLTLEGPIRLEEPGRTNVVILASQAELSSDLRNGILLSARMVMARELQLAAARIERRDGRFTVLDKVVASSCEVCRTDPTPLWEIRARQVVHDAETRQIVFSDAQFRAMGVPIAYLPRLRMPAPGVTRMSGFLRPSFRTTSGLGPGIKIPYFFALGPSRDLTVTPYIAASRTRTLEARYRQAFDWGKMEWSGALSRDDIIANKTRGYLFGELEARLPDAFKLTAQLRMVSDDSYLLNYGVSGEDRLWSGVNVERVRRNELIWTRVGNTHSIRPDESNTTQPMLSGMGEWVRSFRPNVLGGEASIRYSMLATRRASTSTLDGDGDGVPDGRDMVRGSLSADWRRNWLLSAGILGSIEARFAADVIETQQDPSYSKTVLRGQPTLATELRWPWVKTSGRAAYVIEPVAQIVWAPDRLSRSPNEDSQLPEFDEGNLFSLSRYPGEDARETGLRANLGLSFTRYDNSGWSLGVAAGRIFRQRDLNQFTPGTGLSGLRSDWLLSTHVATVRGLTLSNRALFDDGFSISRDELRLSWSGKRYDVSTGYLWLEANPAEMRDTDMSELLLDTGWTLGNGWSGTFSSRYDFTAQRAARAEIGLRYTNECVAVDLSLSRRFTSSTSVTPETNFGFSVQLVGFGAGGGEPVRRMCGS
ncbi:LPS-assembly protein LptD [Thioclava atlantica]|uniref:LPS-assembly protein LptD n=1 Tax=Thioclava atlantica TaxID=1317124 RepID=A0A085TWC4_9RHOB|nr:LPS assembly protein LptD [Thioclava atlantica]KFE35021.1 organic solvent tolerance protein [Thioclava atlantica]